MKFLLLAVCTGAASRCLALPYDPSALPEKGPSNESGVITLDITDRNNVDVTSNFRIMVYQEQHPQPGSNLTNDSVVPRQFFESSRSINFCTDTSAGLDEMFVESHCTPRDDKAGSLQSYSITCAELLHYHSTLNGEFQHSYLIHRRREGYCNTDEICINSLGPIHQHVRGRQWATCVRKSVFNHTMYGPGDHESKQRITRVLEKGNYKGASMIVSKEDGTTPTEVDAFNIDAWPEIGAKQSRTCHDCMDLSTKEFATNLNSLKAEARLLTTGAAAAGVLWLTLMAGR